MNSIKKEMFPYASFNTFPKTAIDIVRFIVCAAINNNASDVYLDLNGVMVDVKFRCCNNISLYTSFKSDMWDKVKNKLKILCNLEITNSHTPQSGSVQVIVYNKQFLYFNYISGCSNSDAMDERVYHLRNDLEKIIEEKLSLRLSTHPTTTGECLTIRLIYHIADNFSLTDIGMPSHIISMLRERVYLQHGLLLIAGATGSGKTTTMYAIMNELKKQLVNIMTIEDPVESYLTNVRQTEINNGMITFDQCIRSILRHAPDVIVIGEIRDASAAAAAVRAALLGKFVIATIHAPNIQGVFHRMINLGIDHNTLSTSLVGIISQTLYTPTHITQDNNTTLEESDIMHDVPIVTENHKAILQAEMLYM